MRGFTTIELVMVMVVAGILAVYALPKFSLDGFKNTSARGELVQGIRYAQFQSLYHTDAATYGITINGGGFTVTQGGVAMPDPVNPSVNYIRVLDDTAINNTGSITFNGRGLPTCGGGLTCTNNNAVFNLTTGGASSTVTLERYTGFVH